MTDAYEFSKSCFPQSLEGQSPYVSKQWNYINDINNSQYTNNGSPTLVQFDLSSIYNSTNLIQPDSMYLAIPITYVSVYVATNTLIAPVTGSWASTGLKAGYFQLIHGADMAVDGKTLNQFQPYTSQYIAFKLLSSMSADDRLTLGASLGLGTELDNPQSLKFNGSSNSVPASGTFPAATVTGGAGLIGGNGLSNNFPFPIAGGGDFSDQGAFGAQNATSYNNGLQSRQKRVVDTTVAGNGLFYNSGNINTTITNNSNILKEFKPYYTVNGNYMIWYDVAIVKISDIFDSFKQMPLMKRLSAVCRFYINTGTVVSNVYSTSGNASTGLMVTSANGIGFTNTCPLMQTALSTLPASVTAIASGLFIGTPPNTAIPAGSTASINFANAGASHFMSACRIYYAQIQLKPERLIPYISENRAKKIVYTDFLTNTISNISGGSTFSQLIQSGVSNIRGILIIPQLSSTFNGSNSISGAASTNGITPFSPLQSPYTDGISTGPLSIINLQVSVGGVNVLANPIQTGFDEFLQQVTLYEKLAALDYGVSCGLINENMYQNSYRPFYIDCTRANISDMLTPRNVVISGTNNVLSTCDYLVFTEYFKEIVADVETGLINMA